MKNRNSICPAAWTLVGSVAVNCRNRSQALLVWALCQVKQKTIPARIPLNLTTKQCSVLKGFFTSIAAASAALHRSLESAGCTVKTGWYPPLYSKPRSVGERLHNSIEPKRQNGQSWIISTRHAHLVWKQMEQVVKSFVFSCPFEESIVERK